MAKRKAKKDGFDRAVDCALKRFENVMARKFRTRKELEEFMPEYKEASKALLDASAARHKQRQIELRESLAQAIEDAVQKCRDKGTDC